MFGQFLSSCNKGLNWRQTLKQAESVEKRDDFKLARQLYEQAIAEAESSGVKDVEISAVYVDLARVCQLGGDSASARRTIDHALASIRKARGEASPTLIPVLNASARLYYKEQDLEKAEEQGRQVLALEKALPGPNTKELIDTINLIVAAACARDRCADTEPLLKEQLELRRQLYGIDHPDVAVSMSMLGELAEKKGHFKEAISYQEKALAIMQRCRQIDSAKRLQGKIKQLRARSGKSGN